MQRPAVDIIILYFRRIEGNVTGKYKKSSKAKGWSQEELAIKLNVVRQTVSKWEKGVSHS